MCIRDRLMVVTSISALRGMAPSGERLDQVMSAEEQPGAETVEKGDSYSFEKVVFRCV